MDMSTRFEVMKALLAVAWADDEFTRDELAEIEACARMIGLDPDRTALLTEEARNGSPTLASDVHLSGLPALESHEVMSLARLVASADGFLDPREQQLLRILKGAFEADESGAQVGLKVQEPL